LYRGTRGLHDRKDVFYQADDELYVPRSILMDLEPRVIERMQSSESGRLYNRENMFVCGGRGRGGEQLGQGVRRGAEGGGRRDGEEIEREAENSDSLEAFVLSATPSPGGRAPVRSLSLSLPLSPSLSPPSLSPSFSPSFSLSLSLSCSTATKFSSCACLVQEVSLTPH